MPLNPCNACGNVPDFTKGYATVPNNGRDVLANYFFVYLGCGGKSCDPLTEKVYKSWDPSMQQFRIDDAKRELIARWQRANLPRENAKQRKRVS